LNQRVARLRPKPSIDKHYLFHLLNSDEFERMATWNSSGLAQLNLSSKWVEDYEVDLPSLEEQKRIAGILDEADRVRKKTQALIDKYDELAQSIFLDMFGDPVTNPKGWEVRNFLEFVAFDTHMTDDFEKYGHLYHVGIGNIEKNTGRIHGCLSAADEGVSSGKYLFDERHIIYSKIRPALNKVALPSFKGLCSADAYPLLPIHEVATRHFVAFILRSDFFLNFIEQHSTRTNMPKANQKQLSMFSAFCPPFQLQLQFDKAIIAIDTDRKRAERQISDCDDLFNALLQQAFKGELT
jgi:type I restriction enzyme S subunit